MNENRWRPGHCTPPGSYQPVPKLWFLSKLTEPHGKNPSGPSPIQQLSVQQISLSWCRCFWIFMITRLKLWVARKLLASVSLTSLQLFDTIYPLPSGLVWHKKHYCTLLFVLVVNPESFVWVAVGDDTASASFPLSSSVTRLSTWSSSVHNSIKSSFLHHDVNYHL